MDMKFSEIEKQHLLKAWVAISMAFAILMSNIFSPDFIIFFLISLFTVGLGFLLHEMAHKYVAQRYGCMAEFRSDDKMLIFAVLSAFLGFVFAAPGAVLIYGHVTKEKNGKISIAGPLANVVLSIIFVALIMVFPMQGILYSVLSYGYQINSFIALFNMVPFMNFDGEKILKWSKTAYFSMVAFSALLVFAPKILTLVFT